MFIDHLKGFFAYEIDSWNEHSTFRSDFSINLTDSLNSSFFFKLVQCQPQLNCQIRPIVVEGVCFNHTWPIIKGFCHFSLFKGHPRPQNPQKRGYFMYPKKTFLYIFFQILAIGTSHKVYKHPHVKGFVSK